MKDGEREPAHRAWKPLPAADQGKLPARRDACSPRMSTTTLSTLPSSSRPWAAWGLVLEREAALRFLAEGTVTLELRNGIGPGGRNGRCALVGDDMVVSTSRSSSWTALRSTHLPARHRVHAHRRNPRQARAGA